MLIIQPETSITRNRTIKHNHLFLVDDVHGDIPYGNVSGMGMYHLDTRFLSCFEVKLHSTGAIPLLSSTEMGYMSTIVFTNGMLVATDEEGDPCIAHPETIQLKRETVLYGSQFERFALVSYNPKPLKLNVSIRLDCDFRDMFEIRGIVSEVRNTRKLPEWEIVNGKAQLVYSYLDRSGRQLQTQIRFMDLQPVCQINPDSATVSFEAFLKPRETITFNFEIRTVIDDQQVNQGVIEPSVASMDEALASLHFRSRDVYPGATVYKSDNEDFNEMMLRNRKDMRMLLTHTDDGMYVAAGIPWYVALFGRDSLITSRFCLPFDPNIAKETLKLLAKYQGKEFNPERDEEPGKILHEMRVGELARLNEIPHTPYYGSVDATPLWLILFYEYFLWTDDRELLCMLWPTALKCMDWIDHNLKQHPLGFSTYRTHCERGILQQGWKDSHDSVMDDLGVVGQPPIALSEVQGYVYMAKRCMAVLSDFVGDKDLKHRLRREYVHFRKEFNKHYWIPELDYCALALDDQGKPFKVISSNPGHCLETGIFYDEHAQKVMSRLMAPEMFNGWGIRTLSGNAAAYNPMSYHNGSVWPHDNAMIAQGMAFEGRTDLVDQVFSGLFAAARHMYYKRLPELFCGFKREEGKEGDPPVRYAVACSPQAWAAASMYSLIRSMLNINVNAQKKVMLIKSPRLPAELNFLQIENLKVGNASVDLDFRRSNHSVMVDVRNRRGDLNVVVEI